MFWRTVGSDQLQAAVMAYQITENQETSVALIYQQGSYGKNFVNEVNRNLHDTEAKNFEYTDTDELGTILNSPAVYTGTTGVVFISSDILDIVEFVNQVAGKRDYNGLRIYLSDAAADEQLLAPSNADSKDGQIFGTRPSIAQGSVFQLFHDEYLSETGYSAHANVFAAYTYDATWLAFHGYAWAMNIGEQITGVEIAKGLRQISTTNAPSIESGIGWSEAAAYLSSGQAIDLIGASGKLDYDPDTEELSNPVDLFRIGKKDGERCFRVTHTCNITTPEQPVTCSEVETQTDCVLGQNTSE